jgi:hypothetical protein
LALDTSMGALSGLLARIRDSLVKVGFIDQDNLFISASILLLASKFLIEFIEVYGPADHARSLRS